MNRAANHRVTTYFVRVLPDYRVALGIKFLEWKTKGRAWTPFQDAPMRLIEYQAQIVIRQGTLPKSGERDDGSFVIEIEIKSELTRQGVWKRRKKQWVKKASKSQKVYPTVDRLPGGKVDQTLVGREDKE